VAVAAATIATLVTLDTRVIYYAVLYQLIHRIVYRFMLVLAVARDHPVAAHQAVVEALIVLATMEVVEVMLVRCLGLVLVVVVALLP
jgi:hypothetical protein